MGDSDQSDDEAGSLRRAFEHVKAMREENATLRENFENLKKLYAASLSDKEQLETQHAALQQEMERMDRHYEELSRSWRNEMDAKQAVLESAQAQILKPRDMAALRLKLAEEVEAPHRVRCEFLEQEAEKAQQQAFEARREVEHLKLESEARVAQAVKAVTVKQVELETALREREMEVQRLKDVAALNEELTKRSAGLERQLEASRAERNELLREVEHVRGEKERAVVEKERAEIESEKQAHALKAEVSQQRRHVEALSRRSQQGEVEARQAMEELARAREHAEQLERAHQRASAEAERTIHQLEAAVFDLESRLEAGSAEWADEQQEVAAQLAEKEAALAALQAQHGAHTDALVQDCARKVAEEAERQRDLRRALEGEAADLRASVSSLESDARETDARHMAQLADVRRELDAARKEVQEIEAEKGGLLAASVRESEERKRVEDEAAAARLEAAAAAGESEACRERQRETDTCLAEMRQERDRLHQKLDRSERNLAELAAVAEREREELTAQLELEKQHQYDMGKRSVFEGVQRASAEGDRQAAKSVALKKKLQKYQKLVATLAADRAELLRRLQEGDGLYFSSIQASKHVKDGGGGAPDRETASWYRTQVDMLRERQAKFIRS